MCRQPGKSWSQSLVAYLFLFLMHRELTHVPAFYLFLFPTGSNLWENLFWQPLMFSFQSSWQQTAREQPRAQDKTLLTGYVFIKRGQTALLVPIAAVQQGLVSGSWYLGPEDSLRHFSWWNCSEEQHSSITVTCSAWLMYNMQQELSGHLVQPPAVRGSHPVGVQSW